MLLKLNAHVVRMLGLGILAIDAALAAGLAVKGAVLSRPGGPRYVVAVAAGLAAYAVVVVVLTANTRKRWVATSRHIGVTFGTITGLMWVINLVIESFAGLSGWPNIAATGPFLLGAFVLWGVAAALTRRRTGLLGPSVVAAVSAAIMCVSITLVAGFSLPYVALVRLAHNIDGSPEYLSSGWHDLPAFAIANTLDAAFSHLLIAPIIAAIIGTLTAAITRRRPGTLGSVAESTARPTSGELAPRESASEPPSR